MKFIQKYKASSRGKKFLTILMVALPTLLLVFAVAAELTSRPSFCVTCHYMEPYYESWKHSTHSDVTCVKCHFPPGLAGTIRGKIEGLVQVVNYMTSTYVRRKPWAEIDNASCLQSGCHDERLLKGKVNFKNVVFDHKEHTDDLRRGKKLRCTSCHSQIVQGDHMVVTESTCYLCHFKEGEHVDKALFKRLSDCKTCHHWEEVPKFAMSQFKFDHEKVLKNNTNCVQCHPHTINGDGSVPKENCYNCHFDNERLSKINNIELLHNVHIYENKIECMQCHLQIQHKVQKLSTSENLQCASCHSSTHDEQFTLFTGKSLPGIEGIPDDMFKAGITCASCHIYHQDLKGSAKVFTANSGSCETCHGKGYSRLMKMWEDAAKTKIAGFKKALNDVTNISRKSSKNRDEINNILAQVNSNFNAVVNGNPLHNIKYSDKIINSCYESLAKVVQLSNASYNLPKTTAISNLPGDCKNCHSGIEQLSKPFGNRIFSHAKHLEAQGGDCSKCHSNQRVHGELTIGRDGCNSCHHKDANESTCIKCHKNSVEIYTGTFMGAKKPSLMFEGDVKCEDCHIDKKKKLIRPDEKQCITCHDADYASMATEWKSDYLKSMNEVKTLLKILTESKSLKNKSELTVYIDRIKAIDDGSARGMHNYEFSLELLSKIKDELKKKNVVN